MRVAQLSTKVRGGSGQGLAGSLPLGLILEILRALAGRATNGWRRHPWYPIIERRLLACPRKRIGDESATSDWLPVPQARLRLSP